MPTTKQNKIEKPNPGGSRFPGMSEWFDGSTVLPDPDAPKKPAFEPICEWGYGFMGGIVGDILGSIYQFDNFKTDDPSSIDLLNPSCDYSDDTVMTVATMRALSSAVYGREYPFDRYYRKYGREYPNPPGGGYGTQFSQWLKYDKLGPYYSNGNGSAMRVGPVGWFYNSNFRSLGRILELATQSAVPTHNHPEGIKGAQAVAAIVFLVYRGVGNAEIQGYVEQEFGYNLSRSMEEIRPSYKFDVSCEGTVPVAIRAFLEGRDFEDTMRLVLSVGGDADTLACIAGSIAGARYGVPDHLLRFVAPKIQCFAHEIADFAKYSYTQVDECGCPVIEERPERDWSPLFGAEFEREREERREQARECPPLDSYV